MKRIDIEFKDRTTWSTSGEVVIAPDKDRMFIVRRYNEIEKAWVIFAYFNMDEVRGITITDLK